MKDMNNLVTKAEPERRKAWWDKTRREARRRKREKRRMAKLAVPVSKLLREMEKVKRKWKEANKEEREEMIQGAIEPRIKLGYAVYYYFEREFFGKENKAE